MTLDALIERLVELRGEARRGGKADVVVVGDGVVTFPLEAVRLDGGDIIIDTTHIGCDVVG